MVHKKRMGLIAVILALTILLSGCDMLGALLGSDTVAYEDMEYTRPDPQELESVLEESCRVAREETELDAVVEAIYAFYDIYDRFATNYALANIAYSRDLTDLYWEEEYAFCAEKISLAEAGLDALYYALAESPVRETLEGDDYFGAGFFDAYEGESLWDDTFMAMMEQEARLENRYYEIAAQSQEAAPYSEDYFTQYGTQLEELFVEMICLRQEIAAYAGYASYPEFAYDMYHSRDYTPAQTEAYFMAVGDSLTDLYRAVNTGNVWEATYGYCTEEQTFRYVKDAASAMGGQVWQSFRLLERAGLYDIQSGPNKYDGAFETYLWTYQEPFIFLNPSSTQYDKLSFSHEFGHFTNDFVSFGGGAGTDVAEVHSQGMEYLCLCYGTDTGKLTDGKMADSLRIYVEQSAYALFEQQVYGLTGEELTVENVRALYGQIGSDFGFDSWGWDSRDYVTVSHFFTSPMYVASYVVAGDVAMQIYQQEKAQVGAGLATYENCLESGESYLLQFAQTYGLESPFAPGRLEKVRATFQEELREYL